ncbi:hypothetical protein PVAG01_10709 [Phlyctema vagabunda]|uniref:Uncharacterized protein n=1 Tax=Phlyctema vagabunda TaxID=108571 RepID=A0ABR4P314_9HELO
MSRSTDTVGANQPVSRLQPPPTPQADAGSHASISDALFDALEMVAAADALQSLSQADGIQSNAQGLLSDHLPLRIQIVTVPTTCHAVNQEESKNLTDKSEAGVNMSRPQAWEWRVTFSSRAPQTQPPDETRVQKHIGQLVLDTISPVTAAGNSQRGNSEITNISHLKGHWLCLPKVLRLKGTDFRDVKDRSALTCTQLCGICLQVNIDGDQAEIRRAVFR